MVIHPSFLLYHHHLLVVVLVYYSNLPWVITWYPCRPNSLVSVPCFLLPMAHNFQYDALGVLHTGSGPPEFPTTLDVLCLQEGVDAPMPSFPLGSLAFPTQPSSLTTTPTSPTFLEAAHLADPTLSPSHFSTSPDMLPTIQQALPSPDMVVNNPSHPLTTRSALVHQLTPNPLKSQHSRSPGLPPKCNSCTFLARHTP